MDQKHNLTAADILPMADYAKIRAQSRAKISERKRNRRVEVGPYITFYFENYDTMWMQVHEMLFIEKAGPEQIPDEIAAYNPLIPKGEELVATFMIEIEDADRRKRILGDLGGIEDSAFISIGGERIVGASETDQDRTRAGWQGLFGSIRPLCVHKGADRRVSRTGGASGDRLQPFRL